jgi:hypothetical protein
MRSNSDPSFDQRIADWLEHDPSRAPDAVLETVLAAVPSIPQRRRRLVFGLARTDRAGGWRTIPVNSTFKLAVGATATMAVIVAGLVLLSPRMTPGIGGPGTTPTPAPSPPPSTAWQSHTSEDFAYTIDYQPDWTVTPARDPWPEGGWPNPSSHSVDRLGPASDDSLWVMVSSRELTAGETFADLRAELDTDNASICDVSNPRTVTIDGHEGRSEDQLCFGANHVIETFVSDGVRVYLIDWISPREVTQEERRVYDRMLASLRLGE